MLVTMGEVLPLPCHGEAFPDPRGEGRTFRIGGHPDAGTIVLSIWDYGQCRATFRLPIEDAEAVIDALRAAAGPDAVVATDVDGDSGSEIDGDQMWMAPSTDTEVVDGRHHGQAG